MLIDSHCHLLDTRFDEDRAAVLGRAREKGVTSFVEIAWQPELWEPALAFARTSPDIRCVLGFHPQEAKLVDGSSWAKLEELCRLPETAGIGETGFDYHYENSPRDIQRAVFLRHIILARKVNKPLSIHCRDAYPDFLALLDAELPAETLSGVVHCFSGTPLEAKRLVDRGFLIGIDGPVTYPSAKKLRETVAAIPLEMLVLETDAPYLPPQDFRGQRNEPSYLPLVAEAVARIKKVPVETVAEVTTRNARALFFR